MCRPYASRLVLTPYVSSLCRMRHPYAMRVVLGLVTSVVGSTHWRWSRLGCTRGVWAVNVAFGLYTWRLGPTRCRWVVHVVVEPRCQSEWPGLVVDSS